MSDDLKESAKHLRSIHFTILAVCFGILGIVFFANTQAIERALKDLKKINQFSYLEYCRMIRPLVLEDMKKADKVSSKNIEFLTRSFEWRVLKATSNGEILKLGTRKGWLRLGKYEIVLEIPGCGNIYKENTTLSDFASTWNSLYGSKKLYVPIINGNNLTLYTIFYSHSWEGKDDRMNNEIIKFSLKFITPTIPDMIPIKLFLEPLNPKIKNYLKETNMTQYFNFYATQKLHIWVEEWKSLKEGLDLSVFNNTFFFLPDDIIEYDWSPQESIIKSILKTDWKPGEFKETFPDLYSLTKNLQSLKLSEVGKLLERDKKRAAESFEIFGAKIPSEIIGIWGVLILLLIQLYFTMHIRDFIEKINKSNETINYPWIALYSGLLPKVITVISVCVLPLFVIGIVRYYEFEYIDLNLFGISQEYWDRFFLLLPSLLSLVLGAATIYYFYRLWHFKVSP